MAMQTIKYRSVGNRNLLWREDEVELGEMGAWILVMVESWCQNGWTSLKLFLNEAGPKNLWQVGYKNGRLARNKDAALLQAHHPEVIDWIISTTKDYLKKVDMEAHSPRMPVIPEASEVIDTKWDSWPTREECKKIRLALYEAWENGSPLSPYPQTRASGRYAADHIHFRFGIPVKAVEKVIQYWLMNGVAVVEVFDKKSRLKGIKITYPDYASEFEARMGDMAHGE